jgi:hypothetical protein
MFKGCTKLNYIKVGFTDWHSTATTNWVQDISSLSGTFKKPETLTETHGPSNIPKGWTVVNYV